MPTILFVHGTGVRGEAYFRTIDLISRKVNRFLPGFDVAGCQWGDPFGARLNRGGASIPDYGRTGNSQPGVESAERARWFLLAQDPLLELRILPAEENAVGSPSGVWIWAELQKLGTNAKLLDLLRPWRIEEAWPVYVAELSQDENWKAVVEEITMARAEASDRVARALTAGFQIYLADRAYPSLGGPERDQLKNALLEPVGGPPLGLGDWMLDRLNHFGAGRRGKLTDLTGDQVGDILRYQARGEEIRNYIGMRVKETGASYLMGHSLGAIAAFDWLATEQRNLNLFITLGTQISYFYEIDALVSRGLGSGLPDYFPKWINFFDRSDFLGYPAEGMFPAGVEDHEVDSHQLFPAAHGAYFHNDEQVWKAIADRMAKA